MRVVSYKLAHRGWAVEWYTRYVDAVDASWLREALDRLANTEGLRLAFYYTEGDYLAAVERTFRETQFWRKYAPTCVTLHVPMFDGHALLSITEEEGEDDTEVEIPF